MLINNTDKGCIHKGALFPYIGTLHKSQYMTPTLYTVTYMSIKVVFFGIQMLTLSIGSVHHALNKRSILIPLSALDVELGHDQ